MLADAKRETQKKRKYLKLTKLNIDLILWDGLSFRV